MGKGTPSPSQLYRDYWGLEERRELPQRGPKRLELSKHAQTHIAKFGHSVMHDQ